MLNGKINILRLVLKGEISGSGGLVQLWIDFDEILTVSEELKKNELLFDNFPVFFTVFCVERNTYVKWAHL